MGDWIPPKWKKTWHSKSRGGCKTCKTRRVKCDEQKPQCRRCVVAGRRCDGYDEVPKAWIFESGTDRISDCHEGKGMSCDSEQSVTSLDLSVFNDMFSSPYTTRDSKFAVQFWLRLTDPEGTDCPFANALHSTLGSYVPQAAWHLKAVRHSLLSAASIALVLEARSSNMGDQLESSLSKQSIVHMHLAIRAILKERQTSVASALSAMMMSIICAWTGRWEECNRNLHFCSSLSHELRGKGVHITDDLLVAVDTMIEIIELLPPSSALRTKPERIKYAYQVIKSARLWIDGVIPVLQLRPRSELLHSVLQGYHTRIRWIERQWQDLGRQKVELIPVRIEETAFAPGVLHMQHWSEANEESAEFDVRLFTTQLTLALKFTLLYGASGDAQKLREAAFACHVKVLAVASMLDAEEHVNSSATAPS